MSILKRSLSTFEIIASKIFPAGFGWQASSVLISNFTTDHSFLFAVSTGFGEGLCVTAGHQLWCKIRNKDIDKEKHISYLLGSSAFMSGTSWQPIVNMCNDFMLPFHTSMGITGILCASTFFSSMRLFRRIYKVEKPNNDNRKDDMSLSLSIGGATGCFVATDTSFLGNTWTMFHLPGNFISDCVVAGTSTGSGFLAVQTLQNTLPRKIYLDN